MECSAHAYCPPKSAVEMRCSRGTSSDGTDRKSADDCKRCGRGEYQREDGMGACEICGNGNYSANELSCEFCPVGEFCLVLAGEPAVGRVAGVACPFGSTTEGRGSNTSNDCGCQVDTYDNNTAGPDINCKPCPVGAECKRFGITLAQLPLRSGYWRTSENSSDLRRCPDASKKNTGCIGGVGDEGRCKEYV